jgi:quinol-cytochrome oxidoreductase complex cytochrome b subunit
MQETSKTNSETQSSGAIRSPLIALARWRDEFAEMLSARVRMSRLGFRQTWYLGPMTLGTFTIQLATGVLLMLYYHPSIPQGYADMKDLQFVVSSGNLLRNLHRWSAHAMVFLVFCHMAKVFYRGAYRPPRELNWCVGVVLLLLTLLLSYTGYLLPWDQLSYWGTTVGASIMSSLPVIGTSLRFHLLGGLSVNANVLLRFYVLHTMILPLLVILLISIHLWRLHQDGGMYAHGEKPEPAPDASGHALSNGVSEAVVEEPTLSYGELLFREIIAIETLAAVLITMGLLWNAPLAQLADPLHTPNPAKAPWYFSGLQEMLHYFPPIFAGVLVPGLVLTALVVIPYFNVNIQGEGIFLNLKTRSRHVRICAAVVVVVTAFLLFFDVYVALPATLVVATLLFAAAGAAPDAPAGFRHWLASKPLSFWIMTWFLMELVSLTAVGTLFRGPGWAWVWPWRGY